VTLGQKLGRLEGMLRSCLLLIFLLVSLVFAENSFREAVASGTVDDVKFWLDQGADVNSFADDSNITPLELAVHSNPDPNVATLLIEEGAYIDDANKDHSPLIAAIEYDPNPEMVKALLDVGTPVNVGGKSVLTVAVSQRPSEDTRIVQWLLDAGADPNIPGVLYWGLESPLVGAIADNCFSMVKTLLNAGANPNLVDKINGAYPIHGFVNRDRLVDGRAWGSNPCPNDPSLEDILDILLSYGMDINQPSVHGDTPVLIAAREWESDILKVLLEAGADPNVTTSCDNTALILSLLASQDYTGLWSVENSERKYDTLQQLIDEGVEVDARYQGCLFSSESWHPKLLDTTLILATRFADLPAVELLLNAGAGANAQNASGETALLIAAKLSQTSSLESYERYLQGECQNCYYDRAERDNNIKVRKERYYEIIATLISKGANPNITDVVGNTPIDYLLYGSDIYELLGGVVADVNIFDVIRYGSLENLNNVFEEAFISMKLLDISERSLLFYSAGHNPQPEITEKLLELGAKVNHHDLHDWTPLTYATYHSINPEVLKVLVEAGADLEARNDEGMTALMIAVKADRIDMARKLLDLGARLEIEEEFDKRDALDHAAMSASVEMLKLLLDSVPSISSNKIDKLLSLAVERNRRLDVVRYLIDLGGDVNYQMPLGWRGNPTPLHIATMFGVIEKMKILLEYGADINGENARGSTPLLVALCSEQIDALNLLLAKGASPTIEDFETLKNQNESVWFFVNPDGRFKMLYGECK
jgi:ankyrin repeat protein